MRIGAIPVGSVIGEGVLALLSEQPHPNKVAIRPRSGGRSKRLSWLEYVGDAVLDELLSWIAEHTGFEWNVTVDPLNEHEDAADDEPYAVVFSFANGADAVAFKLRWCDRITG